MEIRPFRDEDEQAVVALWRACGLTRPWNDPHKDIARKRVVQREMFLVGELEGRVIATAMAGYDGHRAWMYYLAVAPAHQGQGFGTLLVRRIEEEMLVRGCPKVSLLVRSTNEQVLAFYRKLGYLQDDSVAVGKRLIPDA
jgi:ribosomal protein S18 acetylase RimI-like enzyme